MVDPEGKTIKITCAVLDEQGKIHKIDTKDAQSCGVLLKGAKRPMSQKRKSKPELSWLDEHAGAYYRHLQDQHYDFIIGHAPYLANGCFNLKDICAERQSTPKTVLIFHGLPKDENGDIDDELLEEWLKEADITFSVGQAVESELIHYIKSIDKDRKPIHKMYIPSYPLELFHEEREKVGEKIVGIQNITMMSGEIKDLDVAGLDFPLSVNAAIGAAEHIRDFDGVRTKLTMLTTNEDDRNIWKSATDKILKKEKVERTGLSFQAETPTNITKLLSCLKKSTLFLLPLKPDSPLFGTEALVAIAAGVPVLVSRYSGLAYLLQRMAEDEPVVYDTKLLSTTDTWRDRILKRLLRPEESQLSADRLREQLLLDSSIAETHLDFINIIASTFLLSFFFNVKVRHSIFKGNATDKYFLSRGKLCAAADRDPV